MDLTDIYRILYPTHTEDTIFSVAHGTSHQTFKGQANSNILQISLIPPNSIHEANITLIPKLNEKKGEERRRKLDLFP